MPFPLDPDTREDQSLPPVTLPLKSRGVRVLGGRGAGYDGRDVAGSRRGEYDESMDFKAWLKVFIIPLVLLLECRLRQKPRVRT